MLTLLVGGLVCQAQVSADRAKGIAEAATRRAASYSESYLLRAHRQETLEDDLFRFQRKPKRQIEKAAYFYEVSDEGYFVLSPSEAVYVDAADGHMVRLVAVSTKSGEAYLLSGFENAAQEFNRLAKDAKLMITTSQDAEMLGRFYFTAVADPSGERLMTSSRKLKHGVEDYFFSNYSEVRAKHLYDKWWSGFSALRMKLSLDVLASKNSQGYETTLPEISGSENRIPLLDIRTLQIAPDGVCELKSIRTVYPRKSTAGLYPNRKWAKEALFAEQIRQRQD